MCLLQEIKIWGGKMKKGFEIPEGIADKIHYYGVIETPSDVIGFYCGGYEIKDNLITVRDMLLDTSVTHKSYIMTLGKIFFDKMEFINYMGMFFPYVPYKYSVQEVAPLAGEEKFRLPRGAKTEFIIHAIKSQTGEFRRCDIEKLYPEASRVMIRSVLGRLQKSGEIVCFGKGRYAKWRWVEGKPESLPAAGRRKMKNLN